MSKRDADAKQKKAKHLASSNWTEDWKEEKETDKNIQDFYSNVRNLGRQVYLVEIPEDDWLNCDEQSWEPQQSAEE